MRSATWITVLVGLFMFQSFWNVAAAFCSHEASVQVQQPYHFGHHQNTLCTSINHHPHEHDTKSDQSKSLKNVIQLGEDHQDHLPSMTHLLVQNEKLTVLSPTIELTVIPQFYWENNYQAPDVLTASPPPEFSPLMVG